MSAPDYSTIIYNLCNELAGVRDRLQIIVDGQIERGHAPAGLPNGPLECGKRKVMLKDAKQICGYAVARINTAINKAHNEAAPNQFEQRQSL